MRVRLSVFFLLLAFLSLVSCGDKGKIETGKSTASKDSIAREPLQLIMLGPPGAGKGTQAGKIEEKFSIPHISTGAVLKAEVERKTLLGGEIEEAMKRGEPVADDIIFRLVEARLNEKDCGGGFILDGFPTTVPQAEELDRILKERGHETLHVIYLMMTEDILLERLLARRSADDTRELLQQRIKAYYEQTAPLIDYYFEKGEIIRINGVQSIDDVFREIDERLAKLGWK